MQADNVIVKITRKYEGDLEASMEKPFVDAMAATMFIDGWIEGRLSAGAHGTDFKIEILCGSFSKKS